jgi:hypothetical protein
LNLDFKIFCTCICKCNSIKILIAETLEELKMEAKIYKSTEPEELSKYGITKTPTVLMNDQVLFSVKTPSGRELKKLIRKSVL